MSQAYIPAIGIIGMIALFAVAMFIKNFIAPRIVRWWKGTDGPDEKTEEEKREVPSSFGCGGCTLPHLHDHHD